MNLHVLYRFNRSTSFDNNNYIHWRYSVSFGFLGPNVLINDGYCYFCESSSGNTVLVVQC